MDKIWCKELVISKSPVYLILSSVLVNGTAAMALIYYLPRYLLDLGYGISLIQFITTLYPFTFTFLPPLLGKFSDKIQNRMIFIIVGSIGVSIFFLVLLFLTNIILLTIILILYAICGSFYRIIFTLYQELVENDPKYITIYNAISVAGWFLGSQIGGIFIDIYGISQIFVFIISISVINILIVIFIRENREAILKNNEDWEIQNGDKIELSSKLISKSIYISLFFRHFGVRPIITTLAILISFHIASDTQIGFLLGFNPLLQFFFMLLTGKIVNKKNEKYIMTIGYFLSSLAILGYIFSTDFFGFLLSQILISASFALFWNATQIYIAQKTNPLNKGKYLGYANSSFFSGGFLGGLFFSFLLVLNPNYYAFMWILLLFPLISTFSTLIKFKSD